MFYLIVFHPETSTDVTLLNFNNHILDHMYIIIFNNVA